MWKKLLPKPWWLLMELVLTRAIWQMMKSLQTWLLWPFQTLRIEFNKSEFNLATYKRGLASVEEQLVFYKKNEVIFCEQLAVLKRDISYKDSEINMIKSELEKLKQEKKAINLKLNFFDNASKSLDKLIGSQIPDKSRKGVGFVSYNDVLPPPTGLFLPLKFDLSNSGLEEFQQPEFEGYEPKTSKSVSEYISNEVRESPDAPLVKELVSDDKLEKKTVFPTVTKIEFVNAVKASTCWVWRPTKLNSASITLKRHNYVDARGTCPISQTSRNLMEDMLPLGEELNEGKLLVKELLKLMCDKKNSVLFTDTGCFVLSSDFKLADESPVLLKARHVNFKTINKLVKENLVRGLPSKRFENDQTCVACLKGKQHKASCKSKIKNSTTQPFFMLHMDLFGPTFDETSGILKSFITEIENLVDKKKDIKREYSVARTPQQNSVAERRNRTIIKAARTMLADSKLPTTFWDEAVNTAYYVQNRVLVVKPHNKTPYELFRGRTHALSFMRPFGCHVTILNTLDYLGKFDGKSDEGFFVGYPMNSKAFRVYNIRTRKVEENLHIRFLEDKPIIAGDGPKWLFDIDVLTKSMNYVLVVADGSLFDSSLKNASNDEPQPSSDAGKKDDDGVCRESGIADQEKFENSTQGVNTTGPSINTESDMFSLGDNATATHADFFGDETEVDMSNITTTYPVPSTPNTRIHKDHSLDHVIGDVQSGVLTRRMTKTINEQGFISAVNEGKTHEDLHTCLFACFLSQKEPKKVIQALNDPSWIEAMQEELLIKKDERGIVIRNKARLVAHGYTQEKGIYYDEVFAPVARIEAIRLFLAYASFKDFIVYQMDMKSAFLYGKIKEEVHIYQPPGFEDPEFSDRVYKVEKKDDGIFISQDKYVDEILKKFGFLTVKKASTPMKTSKPLLKDAKSEDVDVHLYRSMIGSLMYLTSSRPDLMFVVCACARFQVTPKVSHLHAVKRIFRYLKGQPKLGLWYPKDSPFDLEAYSDSDYAGASLDRKSTTGGCQFLGSRLISWQCKKQNIVANSTTEAEYVATASCCGQVLWIQNQMLDYGYNFMNTKIFIDNESTICIVKNLVFHSKTKHIEIRHHFIRDSNEKKLIQMIKIHTD
ncbi:putative ribonuclease H-like domain-containing protein [Tanacetum coccineum]